MSEENITVVEAAFKALAAGGLDAMAAYWTDDIDYRAVEGAADDRGPLQGKDAVRAYVEDWTDTFDDFRSEVVELIDASDDRVVGVIKNSGRAKLSGIEAELTFAAVYTIREGKLARAREYATRAEALEAAGLSE